MEQTNTPKRLTASGAVIPGEGVLEGMYVNSTDSSTMILLVVQIQQQMKE